MAIENLHDFLTDYFTANQCEIIENQNGKLLIQLTDKMDELLMNRPFYWQYVKKLGYPGEPMKVTFITNPERTEEDGEWIHFGSPRIHQIFNTLTSQGKFTKLFEKVTGGQRTAMIPWLVVNVKISYNGKHKKDEVISIGLQLINGAMHTKMMDELTNIPFQNSISDFCYTLTPIIRLRSGFQRINNYLANYLETVDHSWARESWDHLEEEKILLERFYFESEDSEFENRFEHELKDLEARFKPHINIEVINGGLFYLSQLKSNRIII
ncbi:YqhG family protein [Aquibacillus salsiterrae]|uniref:YqhG family protein n=1 Tax=Aquibacillus salsiterrae TaxID=2950439 RepID=A0A9X3WDM0_9BACI|nr:YqhG family protein [Aquibacillus salsiterrae]MDC3415504.1 YqhG family protein [Aquibacillus salsiterrae]